MKHTSSQEIEACMSSWAKDKEVGIWDIKGEEDNLQAEGKNNIW